MLKNEAFKKIYGMIDQDVDQFMAAKDRGETLDAYQMGQITKCLQFQAKARLQDLDDATIAAMAKSMKKTPQKMRAILKEAAWMHPSYVLALADKYAP